MEIPLEDLISFMDGPITPPANSSQNPAPTDSDIEDDDTDIDDNDDDNDEGGGNVGGTNTPTNIDIDIQPDSNIHDIFEKVKSEGLFLVEDDFAFDGTTEKLTEAFTTTFEKLSEKAKESLLESLPDDYKLLVKYGLSTKRSVADFFEDNKEISYD